MSFISLVITLVVVGIILGFINSYVPMDDKIKRVLNAVVLLVVILWILSVFGLIGNLGQIKVGTIR